MIKLKENGFKYYKYDNFNVAFNNNASGCYIKELNEKHYIEVIIDNQGYIKLYNNDGLNKVYSIKTFKSIDELIQYVKAL